MSSRREETVGVTIKFLVGGSNSWATVLKLVGEDAEACQSI